MNAKKIYIRRKKISNKNRPTEAELTTCKRLGYWHDIGLSITDINKLHDHQSLTYIIILTPISIKESLMTIRN